MVMHAWHIGADIYVDELDETYLKSLGKIERIMNNWYPNLLFSKINVGKVVSNKFSNKGYGLLFSGEIDSMASYIRHRDKKPRLINVIIYNDWPEEQERLIDFANQEDVQLNSIRANTNNVVDDKLFQSQFGANWWSNTASAIVLTGVFAPLTVNVDMGTLLTASSFMSVAISSSDLGLFAQLQHRSFHVARQVPFLKSYTQLFVYLVGILSCYFVATTLNDRKIVLKGIVFWLIGGFVFSIVGFYGIAAYWLPLPYLNVLRLVQVHGWYGSSLHVPRLASLAGERSAAQYLAAPVAMGLYLTVKRTYIIRPLFQIILTLARSMLVLGTTMLAVAFLWEVTKNRPGDVSVVRGAGLLFRMILTVTIPLIVVEFFFRAMYSSSIIDYMRSLVISFSLSTTAANWDQLLSAASAVNMFLHNPILGIGLGNYVFNVLKYIPSWSPVGLRAYGTPSPIPNCFFLEILAETGLIGFGTFMWVLLCLLKSLRCGIRNCSAQHETNLLSGMFLAVIVPLTSRGLAPQAVHPDFWALIGLAIALLMSIVKSLSYAS